MNWIEFAAAVSVAIITFCGGYITARRKRKDEVEDKNDDTTTHLSTIDTKLDTDKARLDRHEKQLADLERRQNDNTMLYKDLRDGQIVIMRAVMALLDDNGTDNVKQDITDFLTGKIGTP